MFVKVYDYEKVATSFLVLQVDEKERYVSLLGINGENIIFRKDGRVKHNGVSKEGFMCKGEAYYATPEGYQEFLKEVVNKL